jgi:hypothetical protein
LTERSGNVWACIGAIIARAAMSSAKIFATILNMMPPVVREVFFSY